MTRSRRIEFTCGLISALLGALTPGWMFFGPGVAYHGGYTSAGSTVETQYSGMMSYAQAVGLAQTLPYLALFGLPMAGVVLGSYLDMRNGSLAGRIVLWCSTGALLMLVGLSLPSVGLLLFPCLTLAFFAALFAATTHLPGVHSV